MHACAPIYTTRYTSASSTISACVSLPCTFKACFAHTLYKATKSMVKPVGIRKDTSIPQPTYSAPCQAQQYVPVHGVRMCMRTCVCMSACVYMCVYVCTRLCKANTFGPVIGPTVCTCDMCVFVYVCVSARTYANACGG